MINYINEDFKLYNNDCLKQLKEIETDSIDLIITDPPYNLAKFMKDRQTNLKKMRSNFFGDAGWDDDEYDIWINHMDKFFKEANRVLKKRGSLILFMSIIKVESLIKLAQKHKFYYKTTGIWHKTNPMPRNMNLHFINSTEAWIYFVNDAKTGTFNNEGKALHDFIETSLTPSTEKKFGKHPTQKPIVLIDHFVKILSKKNDIVLDCFMGSGSTGVSAVKQNRKFIGIEYNKDYFDIAKNRIDEAKKLKTTLFDMEKFNYV